MKFTTEDIGCIADGALLGHQHAREVLSSIMAELSYPLLAEELQRAQGDLSGPNDLSDEDDALDIINTEHVEGVYIAFVDGDLCCVEEGDEE